MPGFDGTVEDGVCGFGDKSASHLARMSAVCECCGLEWMGIKCDGEVSNRRDEELCGGR